MAIILLIIGGVFLLDQGSKHLVQGHLREGQSIPVLGDFVRLTHVRNPGGAFGVYLGGKAFYTILSSLAILLLVAYSLHLPQQGILPHCSLSLILGGALGNLIDRYRFGEVVDFLDLGLDRYRWPVFNVADAAVTLGIGLLIVTIRGRKKSCGQEDDGGGEQLGRESRRISEQG